MSLGNILKTLNNKVNCPICKSKNFYEITPNSKENIKLTNKTYSFYRCTDCFVVSQNPLPSNYCLNRHYQFLDERQSSKSNYHKKLSLLLKIKESYSNKKRFRNFIRNIIKFGEKDYTFFNLLNRGDILDLGAGNGIFSLAAKQNGFDVISVEQNENSINIAKKLGIKIISADLNSKLSMRLASQVDNITLNHVMEHIVDPIRFLISLRENIHSQTKVVIVMPNSDSIWRYIFKEKWYGWDPPIHVHLYNKRSLKIIMKKIGYKIDFLSSLNRIDSLSAALSHAGFKVIKLRLILRIIMLTLSPLLKIFNISPEIICIVSKI